MSDYQWLFTYRMIYFQRGCWLWQNLAWGHDFEPTIFHSVHFCASHNDGGEYGKGRARPFLKISHAVYLFPDYLLRLGETALSSSLTSSPSPSSAFQGFPLSGFSLIASLLWAQLAWSPEVGRAVCSVHSVCIFSWTFMLRSCIIDHCASCNSTQW